MSDRAARLLTYVDRIKALISGQQDICVVEAKSLHDGYDDGVIIACGETKGTIICWLYSGRKMDIDSQVHSIIPRLRDIEAKRVFEASSVDATVARFYA
jgi:hypothetical protein